MRRWYVRGSAAFDTSGTSTHHGNCRTSSNLHRGCHRSTGTAIPGATNPIYITAPTATTDNGSTFSVSVSNGSGTVTSNPPAVLTVSTTANNGGGNSRG